MHHKFLYKESIPNTDVTKKKKKKHFRVIQRPVRKSLKTYQILFFHI